jgi:uncharacterized membrane protein
MVLTSKSQNILQRILKLLRIKHTKAYSEKLYDEHPFFNTLYGLSDMLTDYKINNWGVRVNDKKSDIYKMSLPFIGQVKDKLCIIEKITDIEITYTLEGKNVVNNVEQFINSWTGIALLFKVNENSREPNYIANKNREIANSLLRVLLTGLLCILFLKQIFTYQIEIILISILNLIGLLVSYLLIEKQLNKSNRILDRICNLFKDSSCDSVLESNGAKVFNMFSWSEIGFSFFLSNFIIITFFPKLISYFSFIIILALPISMWNIYYQKFIVRKWCVLYVIAQAVIWVIFVVIVVVYFKLITEFLFNLNDIMLIVALYSISFISVHLSIAKISNLINNSINPNIHKVLLSKDVFTSLLTKEKRFFAGENNSHILFGNKDSQILITIFTNPYCLPCARAHLKIEELLSKIGNNICVQYIFLATNQIYEKAALSLIDSYLNSDQETSLKLFRKWFSKIINYANVEINDNPNEQSKIEILSHKEWHRIARINETPSIFINGYKLPDLYSIEDLVHIVNLGFI